jgi:hypothetical protein
MDEGQVLALFIRICFLHSHHRTSGTGTGRLTAKGCLMLGPVKACLVHFVGEHVFCLEASCVVSSRAVCQKHFSVQEKNARNKKSVKKIAQRETVSTYTAICGVCVRIGRRQSQSQVKWLRDSALIFREIHATALGYANVGGHGNAIGPELAARLLERSSEIVKLGVKDPKPGASVPSETAL